jgi:hypothetical protein
VDIGAARMACMAVVVLGELGRKEGERRERGETFL